MRARPTRKVGPMSVPSQMEVAMIWHGDADPIFPVNMTMNTWDGIFAALDATSTLKIEHTEPGMTHTLIEKEFTQLVEFVRAGP